MKSALDCIPCFVSQGLSVARLATDDPQVHERILREVLQRASEADLAQSPALFGRGIHRLVRELTGRGTLIWQSSRNPTGSRWRCCPRGASDCRPRKIRALPP